MTKSRRLLLVGLLLVLVGAIVLVIYGETRPLKRTFYGKVIDLVPKQEELPPGWTVEYKPIADTPEMKKAVAELLNYDDAVYAVYSNGTRHLAVYIAYWTPGKMSHRLVAGHTPDVCWVNAGWKVLEAESGVSLATSDEPGGRSKAQGSELKATSSTFNARDIEPVIAGLIGAQGLRTTANSFSSLPTEARTMELNGQTEHVLFWHVVGGEPVSYQTRRQPPWYAFFVDVLRRGLDQRQEQFFVRISGEDLPSAG